MTPGRVSVHPVMPRVGHGARSGGGVRFQQRVIVVDFRRLNSFPKTVTRRDVTLAWISRIPKRHGFRETTLCFSWSVLDLLATTWIWMMIAVTFHMVRFDVDMFSEMLIHRSAPRVFICGESQLKLTLPLILGNFVKRLNSCRCSISLEL
jgi:hypothetical protein